MNSLSHTEFRTLSERQAQAQLERMLANRRAAERAREERFRKLPTPQQPEPVNFCAEVDDTPPPRWLIALGATLWVAMLVIGLVLMAVQRGWLS